MAAFEYSQSRSQNARRFNPAQPELVRASPRNETILPFRQHALGNQAMQSLLHAKAIQAKLSISTPGDEYEQEADRVADRVMGMQAGASAVEGAAATDIQRKCDSCQDEDEKIRPKEFHNQQPEMTPGADALISEARHDGHALPSSVRAFFEPRFGCDLSGVRLHTDERAAETTRSIRARAYTVGHDIFLGAGQYAPATATGRHLLAHELTHVLQQTHRHGEPAAGLKTNTSGAPQHRAISTRQTQLSVQRDLGDVEEESERMGEEFRRGRRRDLRTRISDMETFPLSTTDPTRGFRLEDLRRLQNLSFRGSLSPLPADAQTLLLGNIEATVRFALDPDNPQRISQLAELRRTWNQRQPQLPWFETPAERVDATDLYHGHVCLPIDVLNRSQSLLELARRANAYRDRSPARTIEEDIQDRIGMGMPTTRPQARQLMEVVGRHQAPFLQLLSQILQALRQVPEATVLYHTWEGNRPRVGNQALPADHPIRHIRTSLADNLPRFEASGATHCEPLINFSFHINRQGQITLLPGSSGEAVRAVEILFGQGTAPATPAPAPTPPATRPSAIQPKFLPSRSQTSGTEQKHPANSLSGKPEDFLRDEGTGQPLSESARRYFEPRFGRDLNRVRVHTDARADLSARALNAVAFTAGNDIAFRAGAYAPATHAGQKLLAHELTHVIQQQTSGLKVQRQTAEEADLSVLRATLLHGIRNAHAFTRDQTLRTRLETLEARIPTMTAAEVRAAIPQVQQMAQTAQTTAASGDMPLTPSAQPSTLDPIRDNADRVIQESRNHQLYQLIQLLSSSTSFGAGNIRRMLTEMNTDLNRIHWFANSDVGFAAATRLESVSGNPPAAQIKVILGPSMLVLMNRPTEDMVPTLYHEIYHAYEQFRTQRRGSSPARPNLAQQEMTRRVGLLRGTPLAGDIGFGGDAISHARSVESELFADLVGHSGMQDPSVLGRERTVAAGGSLVTVNRARTIQAQIEAGLEEIKLVFGPSEGRRIALALRDRANAEALIHPNTRQMFQQLVDSVFPTP